MNPLQIPFSTLLLTASIAAPSVAQISPDTSLPAGEHSIVNDMNGVSQAARWENIRSDFMESQAGLRNLLLYFGGSEQCNCVPTTLQLNPQVTHGI